MYYFKELQRNPFLSCVLGLAFIRRSVCTTCTVVTLYGTFSGDFVEYSHASCTIILLFMKIHYTCTMYVTILHMALYR